MLTSSSFRSVDDLDEHPVALPRRARSDDGAQGAGGPALAADDLAVARGARIGGDDAVDRVLLRADPRQPQLDSHYLLAFFFFRLLLVLRAVAARSPLIAGAPSPGTEGILPLRICFIIFAIALRASSS